MEEIHEVPSRGKWLKAIRITENEEGTKKIYQIIDISENTTIKEIEKKKREYEANFGVKARIIIEI